MIAETWQIGVHDPGDPLLLRSEPAERPNGSESTVVRPGRAGAITGIRVGKRASPQEGWSALKRGVLANLAVASFAHLVQVIRHGLKKIQYQLGPIEGCLAGPGLTLEPGGTPGHHESKVFNSL